MPDQDTRRGLVFSIDRFVAEDGPGVRTTVFLKGCPLRCAWCHSPQSISGAEQLIFYSGRCIRCGGCVSACPKGAQIVSQTERLLLWEKCDDCRLCAEVCPSGALDVEGKWMTAEEVTDIVKRDIVYYSNSGGGVTFSGGEPTAQPYFLTSCLKRCKEHGIHTAIDTSGYTRWPVLEKMLEYIDLFLFDLKHSASNTHQDLTGVSNEMILENLQNISKKGKSIWIRVPLIPGRNDSEENLSKVADIVKSLESVTKVTLLPYNNAASAKYEFIGEPYTLKEVVPHSDEEYHRMLRYFSNRLGCHEDDLV